MDKILVEIILPAANDKYDIYIPRRSKVYEVIELLGEVLSDLSNGFFIKTSDMILYNANTMQILDINSSIKDLNLLNGSRLILI